EQVQCIRAQVQCQAIGVLQPQVVVAGDGRVDLHRQPRSAQRPKTSDSGLEASFAAKLIVGGGVRPVEADSDAAKSCRADASGRLIADQRAVGGQRNRQAGLGGASGQVI